MSILSSLGHDDLEGATMEKLHLMVVESHSTLLSHFIWLNKGWIGAPNGLNGKGVSQKSDYQISGWSFRTWKIRRQQRAKAVGSPRRCWLSVQFTLRVAPTFFHFRLSEPKGALHPWANVAVQQGVCRRLGRGLFVPGWLPSADMLDRES